MVIYKRHGREYMNISESRPEDVSKVRRPTVRSMEGGVNDL
jgi:hypothetical protein